MATEKPKAAEKWDALRSPFPADSVRWRIGAAVDKDFKKARADHGRYPEGCKARFLAYINARDVMDRLDDVVGNDDWHDEYRVLSQTPWAVECTLTMLGVTHADVGYCNNPTGSEDEPAKAAYSDALKRAAVKFGVGRFLYDMPDSGWVPIDKYGKPTTPILAHEIICTAGQEMCDSIEACAEAKGLADKLPERLEADYGVTKLPDLTMAQAKNLLARLEKAPKPEAVSDAAK